MKKKHFLLLLRIILSLISPYYPLIFTLILISSLSHSHPILSSSSLAFTIKTNIFYIYVFCLFLSYFIATVLFFFRMTLDSNICSIYAEYMLNICSIQRQTTHLLKKYRAAPFNRTPKHPKSQPEKIRRTTLINTNFSTFLHFHLHIPILFCNFAPELREISFQT